MVCRGRPGKSSLEMTDGDERVVTVDRNSQITLMLQWRNQDSLSRRVKKVVRGYTKDVRSEACPRRSQDLHITRNVH